MSLQDYNDAIAMIESRRSHGFFAGPRPEELIQLAEGALGLRLPPIYRQFVSQYGAGNFESAEFYGVIDENFIDSKIPDGVWVTLRHRSKSNLPLNLIIIGDTGDGDYYCLETKDPAAEAPVIVYQPYIAAKNQHREVVAEDFGRFLLDRVRAEL